MHSCLKTAILNKKDFVLMQKSCMLNDNEITISHSAYYCILFSCSSFVRFKVAIYARKNNSFKYVQRTDLCFAFDIIILNVSDFNINSFQLINLYNEKDQLEDSDKLYIIERTLKDIHLSNKTLILDDFNAYHF